MWTWMCLVGLLACVCAQSNYDSQSNSIEYNGNGLPETSILDGKVTRLDDIAPIIFLNRTKAALNCAAGYMQIDLKFENPFIGIVYADFERSSACSIAGNGTRTARLDLPLKGCGTKQDPTRVFTNNIVVRFHPGLEMEGDEVITIVCRYPPPVAPPPAAPVVPVPLVVQPQPEAPLKGFQILLIICAILFLSLVLLGLAASYYCLRNQRVQVIRRHPLPLAGSEITKISDTSTGNLSMYEGLKIPRAHAHMTTTASLSESEVAIVSGADTIPSDYPSESPSTSHSEVEDVDGRSLRRSLSSSGSYENKPYTHESSYYSEQVGHLETEVIRHRPPPPEPKFNVEMRVKKAPLPPPTPSPASSDSEGSLIMQERNLSTIHERDEIVEMTERPTTFTYKPEIHSPPKSPPIYSEVIRKNLDKSSMDVSKTEYVEEMFERSGMEESDFHRTELSTEVKEPPVVVSRRPEITSHFVDDVFLRTITEKKTIEDIERHRRQVTEYHAKPLPPPTKWDVEIRNYPNPNAPPPSGDDSTTDWDTHSENSSIYGVPPMSKSQLYRTQMQASEQYRSTLDIPVPNPPPVNWESLVKVLEHTPVEGDSRETYRSEQVLTLEDKKKWRKIITTESTLRTLLTEATVREDYERIRRDQRYEKLFEPPKWDIIIRILTPQDRLYDQKAAGGSNRYRRKSEWDTRSRRNSLPTLYEHDSDGSSIKHLNLEAAAPGAFDPLMRSRRTSRSSMRSDIDVRSMSEIVVDFARPDVPDNMSDGSSYYRPRRYYDDDDEDAGSMVRSLSQPSLARSASEFTESWGIRGRNWDSPEHSPRSSMRSSRHEQGAGTSYNMQRSMYEEKRWYGGDVNEI